MMNTTCRILWMPAGPAGSARPPLGTRTSPAITAGPARSEEHTSELQSHSDLVCRLLPEKKNSVRHGSKATSSSGFILHLSHPAPSPLHRERQRTSYAQSNLQEDVAAR